MSSPTLRALGKHTKDEFDNRVYACPLCGGKIVVGKDVFYGRCDTCEVSLIDYKPEKHQENFHKSKARYKLNLGGFGSGKTTMGAAEVAMHALEVENGRTALVAQTLSQLREAALPELDKMLPPWLITRKVNSPLPRYTLINGHEILAFASDDEQKLRSLGLSCFWMVEASGIPYSVFSQLQLRLRHPAAIVKDADGNEIDVKLVGIVESNPEEGWIRDEFLLRSSVIKASKSVDITTYAKMKAQKPEKAFHSFLSASVDNPHLHKDYISDVTAGKSDRWIKKYIYCSLETKEGLVYPEYLSALVDPFPMDNPHSTATWLRMGGFDKGWNDTTCLVMAAIDSKNGILYVYDEYAATQKPITHHATQVKEKIFGLPMYRNIQADPSIKHRNDRDGVSYQDYFFNVSGVYLEAGNNSIGDGIERVRDMLYRGTLKIFTTCVNLKEEASKYAYSKAKDGVTTDTPIDRFNHLMDALRYLVMALPYDLTKISTYGNDLSPTKDNLISRIQPDSDISELLKENKGSYEDGYGGVYGFNKF